MKKIINGKRYDTDTANFIADTNSGGSGQTSHSGKKSCIENRPESSSCTEQEAP